MQLTNKEVMTFSGLWWEWKKAINEKQRVSNNSQGDMNIRQGYDNGKKQLKVWSIN